MKLRPLSTVLLLTLLSAPFAWSAESGGLELCPAEEGMEGSFADCTEAQCDWDEQSPRMVCKCVVRENVASVTTGGCQDGARQELQSRYPGVTGLGICTSATNDWGDCLGVECRPGPDGSTLCACKVATSEERNSTQYVIAGVGKAGASTACSSDVYYSSATTASVAAGSVFLGTDFPEIYWVHPGS